VTLKIAFAGRALTGKDTRADALALRLGESEVLRLAFANPMKAELAAKYGITVAEVNRRKSEFRSELQAMNDPWKWVLKLHHVLADLEEQVEDAGRNLFQAYVVTDCRKQAEVDILHEHGFYVVRLNAEKAVLQARYLAKYGVEMTDEQWEHPTEAGIAELVEIDAEWDATENPAIQIEAWLASARLTGLGEELRRVGGQFAALFRGLGSLFQG
jgi:hypothetical protein